MPDSTPDISVGVTLPHRDATPDVVIDHLHAVEASSLDHVFTADHVSFNGGHGMDGLAQMAWALGATKRIKACVGVYLLALRHPTVVARQLSTISTMAPGRLIFGVGVGGEDRSEMWSVGVDPATRGRRTDEYLDVLGRLATGEAVSHRGEFVELSDVAVLPAPRPRVPILIGGRSDKAVTRTARYGDGWLASWCSSKRFASAVVSAAEQAEAFGRVDVAWTHGIQLWVGVGDDRATARSNVGPAMESFYGVPFEAFEKYTPMGTADDIAEFLAPYVEAGASMFNLTPIAADPAEGLACVERVKELLGAG